MSILCNSCGHDNQDDALYCDECGEELTSNTSSTVEEEIVPLEETNSEQSGDRTSFEEVSYADESNAAISSDEETDVGESEVETTLSETGEIDELEVTQATEATEQSPSSLPIGAATRLELDEPPIKKIASPATTLELPELPKAVLINQETEEKFILPSEETTVYMGRVNEEFPIQVDLSAIPNADLISRVHAAIHRENEGENEVYYLEDAGSANGTWLNDIQIQTGSRFRQQLTPGDTIAFGRNQTIKFTFDLEQ